MLTEEQYIDLYKNGYSRACSIFARKGASPETCDDVAQDMYERMWRRRADCTELYSPMNFWFLNLRYALYKILPMYQRDGVYIITNSDVIEYLKDVYPDPSSMEFDVILNDFLGTLPDELAQDILAKYNSISQADAYELLDSLGYRKGSDKAYLMRIKRLKDDPDIQRMLNEFIGR
jgi:DNA-directed RNA polymerase specialized sigma24 family protein